MSAPAGARRGVGPGRLDPTVRALLRAFLSPTVADRYASALQPIAVADRDAAIAGAVSTLRARYYVMPEEIAVALVEDTGWPVSDVSTLLGLPAASIRAALIDASGPRVGAVEPVDLTAVEDEAALVDALLGQMPATRRDGALAAADIDDERVDVELATRLPAHVGLASLEARIKESDRRQRRAVNLVIVGIIAMVALTVDATRTPNGEVTLPGDVTIDQEPGDDATTPAEGDPSPSVAPTAVPAAERPDVPIGPALVAEARFVASVDPSTGEPGTTLTTIGPDDDARLWVRMEQLPRSEVLMRLTFTDPGGGRTVRPVVITARVPLLSVRLPDELPRIAGRYSAVIEAPDSEPLVVELQLVTSAATTP